MFDYDISQLINHQPIMMLPVVNGSFESELAQLPNPQSMSWDSFLPAAVSSVSSSSSAAANDVTVVALEQKEGCSDNHCIFIIHSLFYSQAMLS